MTTATPLLNDDFEHFYLAHFRDTVALVYSYTADLAEAQDIAQETFCRAWVRWGRLAQYDNPAAWVRRVAFHLAHSRWRRVRTATAHLVRQRVESTAEINPDHVAVVAALRKLPKAQREALVLHHLADLPIDEVAHQMQAPVGTVKSWLHRGRAAMSQELSIDVDLPAPPPVSEVARISKRRRTRTVVVAGVLALVLAGVVAVLQAVRSDENLPPVTPSPTGHVDPLDPMRSVDWVHATIVLSMPDDSFCPSGPVTFEPDRQGSALWERPLLPNTVKSAFFSPQRLGIGDLNGDGRAEAAFQLTCTQAMFQPEYLVAVERRADGTLHQIALALDGRDILGVWIRDGVIHADHRNQEIRQVDRYRLDGSRLTLSGSSDGYPPKGLDLSPVADEVACPTLLADQRQPNYIELGRIGQPYLLLVYGCRNAARPTDVRAVLFDQVDGVWVAKQALPVRASVGVSEYVNVTENGRMWFGTKDDGTGYVWNGQAFVR